MATKSTLRLGARVRFKDRWAGTVAAAEIDEEWEVLNVSVQHGFPRARSVRLPFQAAVDWNDSFLAFDDTTSGAAFRRELVPVAAPSRPISKETPVAGGGTLAGLIVDHGTRRALEVIFQRSGRLFRVPVSAGGFEGNVFHPGVQPEAFVPYYTEDELQERVRRALASARGLTPGEVAYIGAHATESGIALTGNVRTANSREAARRAVAAALGLPVDASGLADDLQLETEVGLALERAGLTRTAELFVRCTMGEAQLLGYAPSQAVAAEAARITALVPGVRTVRSRIETGAASGPASLLLTGQPS